MFTQSQSGTTKEKVEQLEKLTRNTTNNGIGDVEATSNVLKAIGISADAMNEDEADIIERKVAESILNSVSNLVQSNLRIARNEEATRSASKISNRLTNLVKPH